MAVLGAGGKSGLLVRLGNELAVGHRKVLLTSLTHSEKFDKWTTLLASGRDTHELMTKLQQEARPHLLNALVKPGKYSGIPLELLGRVRQQVDMCLFECDGARGRSLKAHDDKDPSVPEYASQAIVVVGADVVNTAIADGLVHRPQLLCQLWKLENSSLLRADIIAEIVTAEKGYGHKIPNNVPRVYFVNKGDTHPVEAEQLAGIIGRLSGLPTYMGSVKANWCVNIS